MNSGELLPSRSDQCYKTCKTMDSGEDTKKSNVSLLWCSSVLRSHSSVVYMFSTLSVGMSAFVEQQKQLRTTVHCSTFLNGLRFYYTKLQFDGRAVLAEDRPRNSVIIKLQRLINMSWLAFVEFIVMINSIHSHSECTTDNTSWWSVVLIFRNHFHPLNPKTHGWFVLSSPSFVTNRSPVEI